MTLMQRDSEKMELGEQKMALLVKLLFKAGRTEDLERATDDVEYRKKLYQELGI